MRRFLWLGIVAGLAFALSCDREGPVSLDREGAPTSGTPFLAQEEGDPYVLAKMHAVNRQLVASGKKLAVESIEFFTIGQGRPSNRIHQQPFRWVANDARRLAQGIDITYLVDKSDGQTSSGLSSKKTEDAIDRGLLTWDTNKALDRVDIVKRADRGGDPDIFDSFFGFGDFGDPFLADIVNAGWLPCSYFEAVGGRGGGRGILAFSVTFIFTDDDGNPTDINKDGYLDTALNEVYYNDTFGDPTPEVLADPLSPGCVRTNNPWGIDIVLPGIDVETVALHENGHSLELGHFGPPPDAIMNPVYAGIRQSPLSPDESGMQIVWGSWPK